VTKRGGCLESCKNVVSIKILHFLKQKFLMGNRCFQRISDEKKNLGLTPQPGPGKKKLKKKCLKNFQKFLKIVPKSPSNRSFTQIKTLVSNFCKKPKLSK
jgi:hypothetical protein